MKKRERWFGEATPLNEGFAATQEREGCLKSDLYATTKDISTLLYKDLNTSCPRRGGTVQLHKKNGREGVNFRTWDCLIHFRSQRSLAVASEKETVRTPTDPPRGAFSTSNPRHSWWSFACSSSHQPHTCRLFWYLHSQPALSTTIGDPLLVLHRISRTPPWLGSITTD